MKTNKSYSKRIRITKNGKMLARKTGQSHYNAKESGRRVASNKGGLHPINIGSNKDKARFFPNTNVNKN